MKKTRKEIIFGIFAIILIILFAVSITPKTLQNDTFYTIKIGELISQNGIDMQEHFSWHEGLPYTYPHWLYDLSMYFIYNIGSWTGIYISTCVLAAILGICMYKVNSRLTKNPLVSFIVTIGALYLLKDFIAARAQLVTFILLILLVYNIEKFLQNKKAINAIALLIIHTLIANLHVAVWPFSFILYLPYIAEYLVCEIADIILYKKISVFRLNRKIKKAKSKEEADIYKQRLNTLWIKVDKIKKKRAENSENPYKIIMEKNTNVRWLILIMIIALFTGFLTPLGNTPYTYTILTFQGNTTSNINEHLPLTLANNIPIYCTIIIVLALLIFTKAKIKLSDLFMICGLTFLMFLQRRQSSMFALIGALVLTRTITQLIDIYGKNLKTDMINKYFNKFTATIIGAMVIILCINFINETRNDPYINESKYPVQASEWILENLDTENIKLYNEYNYGSYLLYKGIPVFIDSRADLYAPEFNTETGDPADGRDIFIDFINSSNIGTYYGDIFRKYEITHVMVYKNSKINMLIQKADSEKYKLIYSDDYFVIYEILEY